MNPSAIKIEKCHTPHGDGMSASIGLWFGPGIADIRVFRIVENLREGMTYEQLEKYIQNEVIDFLSNCIWTGDWSEPE